MHARVLEQSVFSIYDFDVYEIRCVPITQSAIINRERFGSTLTDEYEAIVQPARLILNGQGSQLRTLSQQEWYYE